MIDITFSDFCIKVAREFSQFGHESQRYGQWFYNDLSLVNPALAEHIRGSKYDPFYKERISDETMQYLALMWGTEPKEPLYTFI